MTTNDDWLAGNTFDAFYRDHYRRVVAALLLAGVGADSSEDFAQLAFAKAFARWQTLASGRNPAGWVYIVALRAARRRRRFVMLPSASIERGKCGDPGEEVDLRISVMGLLRDMPLRRRSAALLSLFGGLTSEEIARELHMSPATVRVHVHDARMALRDVLSSELQWKT